MNFTNINTIKKAGFEGFKTIEQLSINSSCIKSIRGIYLILNLKETVPIYLKVGSGGHFKNIDPNVSIERLQNKWVDNALVLYIGKAGGEGKNANLNSRLKQYLEFGNGKNVGHKGGRFIWQLSHSKELVVCWKPLPTQEPRSLEKELISLFEQKYFKKPFANINK